MWKSICRFTRIDAVLHILKQGNLSVLRKGDFHFSIVYKLTWLTDNFYVFLINDREHITGVRSTREKCSIPHPGVLPAILSFPGNCNARQPFQGEATMPVDEIKGSDQKAQVRDGKVFSPCFLDHCDRLAPALELHNDVTLSRVRGRNAVACRDIRTLAWFDNHLADFAQRPDGVSTVAFHNSLKFNVCVSRILLKVNNTGHAFFRVSF